MLDIKKDIQAMTTFRRNPRQRLLDIAAQADATKGIRQGLEDVRKGRVRPARAALEKFRRSRAIPR
jgi:hypothetical protein